MGRFEPRTSDVGSDHSFNGATTTNQIATGQRILTS